MSARKSVYVIKDQVCDGGQSPNAYVPRITTEVRVHFPPNTVSYEEVDNLVLDVFADVRLQVINYFEERKTRERR